MSPQPSIEYRVQPFLTGWEVVREGERLEFFATQDAALKAARDMAGWYAMRTGRPTVLRLVHPDDIECVARYP